MLASLETFQQMWISKQEYEEGIRAQLDALHAAEADVAGEVQLVQDHVPAFTRQVEAKAQGLLAQTSADEQKVPPPTPFGLHSRRENPFRNLVTDNYKRFIHLWHH